MSLTLIIANKAYSSWSFRPWILMRHFGIAFDEIVIPLAQETIRGRRCCAYSPARANARPCVTAKSPYGIRWRSSNISPSAIPEKPLWPKPRAARAEARSLAAEMHSGFMGLRVAYCR